MLKNGIPTGNIERSPMLLELVLGSLLFSSESSRVAEGYERPCGGRPAVYFQLLDAPLVQSELNLTAEQQAAIAGLHDDYARRSIAARQKAAAVERDIPLMMQARSRLQLEFYDLDQSARGPLEAALSDAQEARLTQIFRQLLGPELFKHENYLAPLRLSATQSAAADTTLAEYGYKMERATGARRQESLGNSDPDRQREINATFARRQRDFEDAALAMILSSLDDAQRSALNELYGKQLDRHELRRQIRAAAQARSR